MHQKTLALAELRHGIRRLWCAIEAVCAVDLHPELACWNGGCRAIVWRGRCYVPRISVLVAVQDEYTPEPPGLARASSHSIAAACTGTNALPGCWAFSEKPNRKPVAALFGPAEPCQSIVSFRSKKRKIVGIATGFRLMATKHAP